MLVVKSPDGNSIVVLNKRHDSADEDTYCMVENSSSGGPVTMTERLSGEDATRMLLKLAGRGWTTQFLPDKGALKRQDAPSSDYLHPSKG